MRWETVRADEFCESVRDGTHDTPKQTEIGYKLVTGKHIKNGQIDPTDAYCISEKDYKKINERSLVEQWDVIMSMIGTVGEVAVVKDQPNYAIKNVALFKCEGSELKGKWLAYYLQSADAQGHMSGNQKGSSQQFLSLKQLRSLLVPVTDETNMQRVVDILSTYDDLIENNQNQIKLLEEAAQRLYKEWFVDLRFPGHESTPIVDGVPEGWTKTNINAVMTFHRGYDLTKNNMVPGKYPVVGSTSIIGYHNEYKISGPGVVTGRSGSLGEYQLIWEDFWPHNTSLYLSDMKGHHVLYLYGMLQTVDFSSLNNGGAIPTLNRNALSNIAVLEAPQTLQQEYVRIAEPYYQTMRRAKKQILYLQEARDRLLPKLMSGEVEV